MSGLSEPGTQFRDPAAPVVLSLMISRGCVFPLADHCLQVCRTLSWRFVPTDSPASLSDGDTPELRLMLSGKPDLLSLEALLVSESGMQLP
jgi:hypothetical protein